MGKIPGSVTDPNLTDFKVLSDRLRAGCPTAALELFEVYGPHVYRVVRRHLHRELRTRFDSSDFVQAVWKSIFFNRQQICDFTEPQQFIKFLTIVARNKVIQEIRRQRGTAKRDLSKERPIDPNTIRSNDGTPSEFAMARERWDQLLNSQPRQYQTLVQMKYMGSSNVEIAAYLNISTKTVGRVLDRLCDSISKPSYSG